MRILISGATGHIGRNLSESLKREGHEITSIVRDRSREGSNAIYLNFKNGECDIERFEDFDVFVHLAGENIMGVWTPAKKRRIRESRINSTLQLTNVISRLSNKPDTLICASAVGYYGDRGDEILTEKSSSGNGFLPSVSVEWEATAREAEKYGVRVVNIRTGMVLDSEDGALKSMLLPFRMGLGGKMGNGKQFWSWISIQDEISAISHIISNGEISGPVNLVSPDPVRNEKFTEVLAEKLNRPAFFTIPEFILNLFPGNMAHELFLCSARVLPEKLRENGYVFRDNTLKECLESLLGDDQ